MVSNAATRLSNILDAARENNNIMLSIADKNKSQAAAIEQTEVQANELDLIVDIFVLEPGKTSEKVA